MSSLLFLLSNAAMHHYQNPLFHYNPVDQYCVRKEKDVCEFCISSIVDEKGRCNGISSLIPKCVMYDRSETCVICEPGYKPNKGQCVKIDPSDNCLVYFDTEECLLCKKGLREENHKCVPEKKCTFSHCNHCSTSIDQEMCLVCRAGLTVKKYDSLTYVCVPEKESFKNCIMVNDKDECLACKINYFFHEGKCLQTKLYYFDLDILYS